MSKHIPGLGCKCAAHDESECGCADVDWRSSREVEMERQLAEAQDEIKTLQSDRNHWATMARNEAGCNKPLRARIKELEGLVWRVWNHDNLTADDVKESIEAVNGR